MRRLVVLLVALAGACAVAQLGLQGIKWRGYKSGTFSNVAAESTFILNNEADFQSYWQKQLGEKPQNAPKDVKWGEEMLVAVHLGRKPNAGYSCFVKSVERSAANTITITFVERVPSGGFNAQVVSSPYEIIRMDRVGGNIQFKKDSSSSGGIVPGPGSSQWRVYMTGDTCSIDRGRTQVIANSRQWQEYWQDFTGGRGQAPAFDFENEWLIAIHAGKRATTGHDIIVTSVELLRSGGLGITYVDRQPARDQVVTVKATSPYSIIRVPKFTGEAYFDRRIWDNSGG